MAGEEKRLLQQLMIAQGDDGTCLEREDTQAGAAYMDEKQGVLGCPHYSRKCKLVATCCQKRYGCRLCHDEEEVHEIDRHATKEMVCMLCFHVQPIQQECLFCHEPMGKYYCGVCRFADNGSKKKIYHCGDCGICRRGTRDEFIHCPGCNACISKEMAQNHTCLERLLESDCPICLEYMFTSTKGVTFLRCGHPMHVQCLEQYSQHSYTCPVCFKSIVDPSQLNDQFEASSEAVQVPEELQNSIAHIQCNDCLARSEAPFRFFYHKCAACSSFNTRVESVSHPNEAAQ